MSSPGKGRRNQAQEIWGIVRKHQSVYCGHRLQAQLDYAWNSSSSRGLEVLADVQKKQMPRNFKEFKLPLVKKSLPLSNCHPLCRQRLLRSRLSHLSFYSSGHVARLLLPWVQWFHFTSQNRSCLQGHQPLCTAQFQKIIYWSKHRFQAGM